MYCPSCGNEITVELKYCNRCGANLSLPSMSQPALIAAPVKLTAPTVVLGLTITCGLGIIFGGATQMAQINLHPAAIVWMVLFSTATLFGCTALLIRFWTKMITLQRKTPQVEHSFRPPVQMPAPQQIPPRLEPVSSVTEHTTRTFTPVYREASDR